MRVFLYPVGKTVVMALSCLKMVVAVFCLPPLFWCRPLPLLQPPRPPPWQPPKAPVWPPGAPGFVGGFPITLLLMFVRCAAGPLCVAQHAVVLGSLLEQQTVLCSLLVL